jgi:hypothetical protein
MSEHSAESEARGDNSTEQILQIPERRANLINLNRRRKNLRSIGRKRVDNEDRVHFITHIDRADCMYITIQRIIEYSFCFICVRT